MRICLVAHGFPPNECTGVEGYTSALAQALAGAGHVVEVFVPRRAAELPNLSMRREERDGFGITWITTNVGPSNPNEILDQPGVAVRFGDYLDREKPEVIHFQHLIKLGLGLLEEAKTRRIPSLYTAHDYYSICHRVTLIKPNLQRCESLGDAAACARCDLGLAYLNQLEDLGDYQLGALKEQLTPEQWDGLAQILEGQPEPAGFSEEDQEALFKQRAALDRRRLEVYSTFDLILSPTRFLRERMIEGGLSEDKIEILTYGAETRDLADLPRATGSKTEALRFGYMGGLAKQKGVHILLEAFGMLDPGSTLSIWGASSDSVYVNQIRQQAKDVGAKWMGAFERSQLRAVLEQVDVVVVPSIWVENFPFVIREALAAGRPVITSDVGALPESVQHEKDGLLFEAGNAAALARTMARCIEDESLVGKLAQGSGPIKSIEEQVQELEPIYTRLISSNPPLEQPNLPESLRPWAQRYDRLAGMPQRDLFRMVLEKLTHMPKILGEGEKRLQASISSDALANYSRSQVLLRDLKRERVWLKTSVEDHAQADRALREKVSWREEELDSSKKEGAWLRSTVADLRSSLQEKDSEAEWLRQTLKAKDEEIEWMRESIEVKQKESNWLRQMALEQKRESTELQRETEELHTQTQAELDAANQQFIQAIERLRAQRELLGIASAQLEKLQAEIKDVAQAAEQHLLIRHTKLGKRLINWVGEEGPGIEEGPDQ